MRYWYKRKLGGTSVRIFEIGDLLNINLPDWGYVGELVITSVDYQLDGHGARTLSITLKHKSTYALATDSKVHYDPVSGYSVSGDGTLREAIDPSGGLDYDNEVTNYEDGQNGVKPVRYAQGLSSEDQALFNEFSGDGVFSD